MSDLPNIFDLTPGNPAFNDDPHALLDRLREECPVRRDTIAGAFMISRYADVRAVLSDISMWRSPLRAEEASLLDVALRTQRVENSQVPEDEQRKGILLLDDPDHARIRQPIAALLQSGLPNRARWCSWWWMRR